MDSNPIYKFMKENNLTDMDEVSFVKAYSNPQKASQIHQFMVENKLTDLDAGSFYSAYFDPSKKKGATTQDSNGPVQQPGKPSAPSFGQKVTEKITNSASQTQIPLKTGLQSQEEKKDAEKKAKIPTSKYFEVDVEEKQDEIQATKFADPIVAAKNSQKSKAIFNSVIGDKDIFKMPTAGESKEYATDITSGYLDYLEVVGSDKSDTYKEKYKTLKAKSKADRTDQDEKFLRQVESEAVGAFYDAKEWELGQVSKQIDDLQKTAVTDEEKAQLNDLYGQYEKKRNSLLGTSSVYAQNKLQYGKIAGTEMADEEAKLRRFEALQAGDGKTIEFFKGIGGAVANGVLSIGQVPKVFGDLVGDTDYDWSDEFYDMVSGQKSDLDREFGSPLPQNKSMTDLPFSARLAVVGGNAIGSAGLFAAGGGLVGATTNLGKAAATFGTAFLTSESGYYQEALEAGMSPQEAALAGTYLAAQTALIESIIPDVKYFEPSAFRKSVMQAVSSGIKSGLPVKEAAKLALKNTIKAIPESGVAYGKTGIKEAGEELLGQVGEDVGKLTLNAAGQREYFNDTFNPESYTDAILGGFIAGGGMSVFSRPTAKSPVQEEVMREIVERRPQETQKGTASDKINKEDLSALDDVTEIYSAMSSHSGWNVMSREEQNHALATAQQIEVMKKEQERMKELRIPDERKDAEIKKLEDEVNQMFSMQMEQDKQKAKDAKIKAIEDEFNKSMEGEEFPVQEDERDQEIVELQKQREEKGVNELDTFLGDMKPMVPFAVERAEQGLPVAESVKQAASNYLYKKYKELTEMKSNPNRMMTRGQIASVQKQLEQDIRTLEGTAETKTEARDQENIQGVSGEVREGKKPVAAKPVQAPSTETPKAGGVLQAPKEEVAPSLSVGSKIQWNVFGNEESGEWIVGEKTKTRGGKDAVVLSKTYVESSQDGKNYTKEYADANGIKYDNERIVEHIVPISELQAQEEVTPTTEAAPKAAPAPKPSLGQRLRTAAEAAETTVTVQEPAPVKEEKKEGVAPAPKKEKKPTETKAKTPEIAPAPRRANSVEASEGDNPIAGAENTLAAAGMNETSLDEWKKANEKDSKKGRIEELTELVRNLMSGKIKFKDYYEKAKQLMPSKLMDKVPAIASFKEIAGSIDRNKLEKGIVNLNKFIKKGTRVGLRIDIPAFNRFGKNVVTVHEGTGKRSTIGYGSTGSISNVTFRTSVSTASKIGSGKSKEAFAMAEGEWLDESPESIQARAEEALNSPEWIQVSMNPTRSSFFYDKADGNPVISADEVLQVGNLVLAKNAQKIDLNTKEGMTQFEKMFSAKTKEGVTYQYRRGTSLGERLKATFDTAGERAAEDIARFLEESGIDVQIIDSVEAEKIGQERNIEGSIDGIFFADKDSGTIYLNKDSIKGKDGATIAYHEGIHPVINIIRNTNPELYRAIVAGIREEAKRNPAVARVIRQVESIEEYQKRGPEAIEDEIVVEVLAQIASGGIKLNELDKTLKQKMIEFFNKLVERMPRLAAAFNLKPVKVDATSQELLDFSKKLSAALTEGGRISDVVGAENVMSYENNLAQESGTIETGSVVYAGQATIRAKKGTKVKNPYRTSVNLPARTLESLLEEYGDNVIVVNSDPTGLGTVRLPSGKVVQIDGGIGYMAIQENIDAGVGFASSSDARVNFLYKTANQMNEDGKLKNGKVLVLVMVQKADSMLGNNYTPDYVADALAKIPQNAISKEKLTNLLVEPLKKETFKSFFYKESKIPKMKPYKNNDKKTPAENKKLKEDHIKKYNAEVAKINESNAKKKADGLAKVDAIEAEIRATDPRTAHDDMVRIFHELSFVQAQKYFDNILGKYTNKTTKYNLEISRLLYQYAGADQRNLFQVLGEKSLVDQLLKDPKSWGYAVAAFVHDTAKQKGKLGGIKHNLFNAKFQGDERYILTEAYKVNDIMTEFNAEQVRKVEEEGKKGAVFAEQQASQGMYPSGKAVIPAKKGVKFGSLQKTSNRFQASLIDRSKEGGLRPSSEGLRIVNGWYSPIEKRLRETKADKQSAQKWLTSGIIGKGDEAIYTGVKGWLESKKPTDQVSKQEIIDWMDNNRVEIEEVSKGGQFKMSAHEARMVFEDKGYDVVTDRNGDTYVEKDEELYDYNDMSPEEQDAWDVLTSNNLDSPQSNKTKYEAYQVEGEKSNYKELLVTLPKNTLPEGYKVVPKSQYKGATSNFIVVDPDGYSVIGGDTEDEAIEIFMRFRRESGGFQSSHFDEKNILVHLRMNIRTDADGNKVLFLEEIQSDWGQKGKKEGFKPLGEFNESKISTKTKPNDKLEVYYNNELVDELFTGYSTSEEIKKDVLNAAKSYFDYSLSLKTTPSAPFVTDTNAWTKLGLKMALREAVKQGADKLSWTTGEQQNQRYDLSKQVDSINYLKNGDGTYQVYAKKNGDIIFKERALEENKLEGAFGKDVAERIINDRGKSEEGLATKVLSGSDLKVGGKGMKGFYDNIVPNVAQALVKELTGETGAIGTTVLGEKTELTKNAVIEENRNGLFNIYDREKSPVPIFKNIETREQAEEILNNPVKNASTQQSIEITPELKAAVQGGMPQFSLIDRSGNDIGPLIEEAADAVEQAIASGTTPQQALDEFIGSQEWYSDLTPGQRKQIDDILQEEFGTTPKVSVKKPTGIKATISNIIDNYYKLKDGDRSARDAINQILDTDPKLKYIYDNISRINKQLQDAGVITDKTDGCP